jgi:hypothetical protein
VQLPIITLLTLAPLPIETTKTSQILHWLEVLANDEAESEDENDATQGISVGLRV